MALSWETCSYGWVPWAIWESTWSESRCWWFLFGMHPRTTSSSWQKRLPVKNHTTVEWQLPRWSVFLECAMHFTSSWYRLGRHFRSKCANSGLSSSERSSRLSQKTCRAVAERCTEYSPDWWRVIAVVARQVAVVARRCCEPVTDAGDGATRSTSSRRLLLKATIVSGFDHAAIFVRRSAAD